MASTFRELYSDFQNAVKNYTEQMTITEPQFMRDITKGLQDFQNKTRIFWSVATLDIGTDVNFPEEFIMPPDCIEILEFRDINDLPIHQAGYTQHRKIIDQQRNNGKYLETPVDTQYRLRNLYTDGGIMRTCTVINRRIILQPIDPTVDLQMTVVYVPDMSAYSEFSPQWALWNVSPSEFMRLFNTSGFALEVQQYENAFLNYAIASYIKAAVSRNYQIYEQNYLNEVEHAKLNKRSYYRGLTVNYNFAINS